MFFRPKIKPEDFEAAAMPYLADLCRTAVSLLGNRTEAEDLVQDVYLQAWKSFHRFELGTNCRAWLYKILFHRLHHHRRKWFQLRLMKDEDSLERDLQYEPPIPDQLTDTEILTALENVPADFREVLVLADVEDFSYKEIAATLDIPMGTVMSRLSRARKMLRVQLAGPAAELGIGKTKRNQAGGETA